VLITLLANTDITNASVICVDKYNHTSIIPCSDQNAIDKASTNSGQIAASDDQGANTAAAGAQNNSGSITNATSNQPQITNSNSTASSINQPRLVGKICSAVNSKSVDTLATFFIAAHVA